MSQMEALPVNVRKLRTATASDPVLSNALRFLHSRWACLPLKQLRPFFQRRNELTMEEGYLLYHVGISSGHP